MRRQPRLVVPFVRSGVEHRLIGPALSRWRPGAVALFHTGRCGSTVLTDLLDQHPEVSWDGETYGRVIEGIKGQGLARSEVDFDPVSYLGGRLNRSGRRWFGFDLKFSHLTEFGATLESYIDGLETLGVNRFVSLRRRNYLRQVISGRNGGRRGDFHIAAGTERRALPPLELDPDNPIVDLYSGSLVEVFAQWDRHYTNLEDLLAGRLVELIFEDDIAPDPLRAYTTVAEALGLAPFEPGVRLQRSNPEPTHTLLANPDDIRRHLAGTGYEWMVEAD